eukprot:3459526-Pyramimonas_sp.AAC.1
MPPSAHAAARNYSPSPERAEASDMRVRSISKAGVAASIRGCDGMAEAERARRKRLACVQGHGGAHSGRTVPEADRCGGAASPRGDPRAQPR